LKQAPQCWFAKLTAALKGYGFHQSYFDYSLFTLHNNDVRLKLVYMDDLIISGNNLDAIAKFKSYLNECLHMNDLGVLKYFLGVELPRNPKGIFFMPEKICDGHSF